MRTASIIGLLCIASATAVAVAQTQTPAKPALKAAAKPSRVDQVIQLVKGGMTESLIVKTLQKTNKPIDLTTADLMRLKAAGVSENTINVMMARQPQLCVDLR